MSDFDIPKSWPASWPCRLICYFRSRLQEEASEANAKTPVFVGHGTQDPVVPFLLGQAARETLEARVMAG